MTDETHNNGSKPAGPLDTVVLTYNRATDHLEIGGAAYSIDLMIDMCGRAIRALEARLRAQQAMQLRETLLQQARDAAIVADMRKGR
ncbi:MAG TPA: hypothetical protein VKB60_00045 [Terriglobales bacterium]|nr:hypothetical protein [Terriglobales bacterium]